MDAITRNNIFIENMELINRTMHRHRLLLFALASGPRRCLSGAGYCRTADHRIFRPQFGPTLSKSISGQNYSTLF